MKFEDRFFPRVWDGERYWYPCLSELGITYESEDLPFDKENIRSLDWALSWRFSDDGGIDFIHIVEACTGLKDKNGKLIYEGDILTHDNIYDGHIKIKVVFNTDGFYTEYLNGNPFNFLSSVKPLNVIGNTNENPELLND